MTSLVLIIRDVRLCPFPELKDALLCLSGKFENFQKFCTVWKIMVDQMHSLPYISLYIVGTFNLSLGSCHWRISLHKVSWFVHSRGTKYFVLPGLLCKQVSTAHLSKDTFYNGANINCKNCPCVKTCRFHTWITSLITCKANGHVLTISGPCP